VAEPYAQWVIERRLASPVPDWQAAGALVTDDVAPYERLKLRALNGSHSAVAYLGGLAGYQMIAAAIADSTIREFIRQLMREDVRPTLVAPPGVNLQEYENGVLRRFANPALAHSIQTVAADGSRKLPQRLVAVIRERRAAGGQPVRAALALAAWMRHVVEATDDNGRPFEPVDGLLPAVRDLSLTGADSERTVAGLLSLRSVFSDLGDDSWLRHQLTDMVRDLSAHGALAVMRALTSPAAPAQAASNPGRNR
jgi:fructuronate reductase